MAESASVPVDIDHGVQAGRVFRHTKSNEPILGCNKITWAHFVRSVWVLSCTNLHPKDFEAEFADELKRMYYPVKVKDGSGA